MTEPLDSPGDPDVERRRIQRARNVVFGFALGAFVILIFAISIVKMG